MVWNSPPAEFVTGCYLTMTFTDLLKYGSLIRSCRVEPIRLFGLRALYLDYYYCLLLSEEKAPRAGALYYE